MVWRLPIQALVLVTINFCSVCAIIFMSHLHLPSREQVPLTYRAVHQTYPFHTVLALI